MPILLNKDILKMIVLRSYGVGVNVIEFILFL